jgi:hypothetical protein
MNTATIYTNNIVSIDGQYVGRVDRTTTPGSTRLTTIFKPCRVSDGKPFVWGPSVEISVPTYIGGPADWIINPEFTAAVIAAKSAF